jgi:hypothetical protein
MSAKQEDIDREAALANLTPEERAAVEDDDLDPKERAALEKIVEGDDDEDGEDGEEDKGEGKADDKAEDKGEAADGEAGKEKPAAGAAEEQEEGDEPGTSKPRVSLRATLPEDYEAKITAVDEQEAELATKFKAGGMEAEEFIAENKRIVKERNALDAMRIKAEMAAEINQQTAEQEWQWNVARFLRQVKSAEGVDYAKDEDKGTDFDNFLKALAANPKNNNKEYEWFLSEAHKRTKVLHGIEDKKPTLVNKDEPEKKPADPKSRKPAVGKLPLTLAQVPGGDGPGDVEDEFSALDGLEGLEYETALAKMTPAQRERYMRAA